MAKALIITEKPSVAREFAAVLKVSGRNDGYLENSDYVITWCVGHLVEMVYPEMYDEKYKKWRLADLPFLPDVYKYDVIESVRKQYDIVHRLLYRQDIDKVYWAGDAGKEGQTIEENIRNFGGVRPGMEELRVWIDSQTEEEILRGIREARPMSDYANLGKSGIMRTIEDYAMGINFSRVMSVKYGRLLNDTAGTESYTAIAVGRVMTCVLGMVVIREREIRNFTETPFYRLVGSFTDAGIEGEWKAVETSAYFSSPLLYRENGFKKREDAEKLQQDLEGNKGVVKELEKSISKKKAPLLFNLAELQAECSKRFKISPDEALQAAQDLYEMKLTTYPRTDARVLSSAVAKVITKNLNGLKGYGPTKEFTEKILKDGLYRGLANSFYTDDSKVTDHYAIIPTGQTGAVGKLNEIQRKVYDLIVRRFLSIFYPPAIYSVVKMTVGIQKECFFASAKVLKEPGYLEVAGGAGTTYSEDGRENENLNEKSGRMLLQMSEVLKPGDVVNVHALQIREGKTSPPKRYTSGSMVLAMENAGQLIEDEELRAQIKGSGIGTSATRAEIIKKLVRIGYLNLNKKTQILTPENLGEMVYEVVNMTVPQLLNPKMTASWEKGLDGITKGTVDMGDYRAKLEDFIRRETLSMIDQNLLEDLTEKIRPFAGKNGKGIAARKRLRGKCPFCDGLIETTPFGYGCSNYKKDGSGCKFAIGTIAGRDLKEEEVEQLLEKGKTDVLSGFVSKDKKKFRARLAIVASEEGKKEVRFDFTDIPPEVLDGVVCPDCGGAVEIKSFGYGCANFNQEDPESCRFFIGTIAGKNLTAANVKELLTGGRTSTIRGFTSKNKKKFDACLKLEKREDGKHGVVFDFESVEAKKLKDVSCPLCGGEIVQTPFGYGCGNYSKEDEASCRFVIGKIAGVKLKVSDVKALLQNGQTKVISGFKSKSGSRFDAFLKLEEGKVVFAFPERPEPEATEIACPKCGQKLQKGQWYYECGCGFRLHRMVAQVDLSPEIIGELIRDGRTKEKVSGFVSKAGNTFDAYLKLEEGSIRFDFEQHDYKKENENGTIKNNQPV
ncbi:MAG: DNA topoisomerase III [Lachnospiraceae bacterium]|nr:DNA topoisomerase III [Lachnospiraceae bacterium]